MICRTCMSYLVTHLSLSLSVSLSGCFWLATVTPGSLVGTQSRNLWPPALAWNASRIHPMVDIFVMSLLWRVVPQLWCMILYDCYVMQTYSNCEHLGKLAAFNIPSKRCRLLQAIKASFNHVQPLACAKKYQWRVAMAFKNTTKTPNSKTYVWEKTTLPTKKRKTCSKNVQKWKMVQNFYLKLQFFPTSQPF